MLMMLAVLAHDHKCAADAHDALCWLRPTGSSCAADARDARCLPTTASGLLMLMMLFAGCALPAASCNTGAAGAHDARGSCSQQRAS